MSYLEAGAPPFILLSLLALGMLTFSNFLSGAIRQYASIYSFTIVYWMITFWVFAFVLIYLRIFCLKKILDNGLEFCYNLIPIEQLILALVAAIVIIVAIIAFRVIDARVREISQDG